MYIFIYTYMCMFIYIEREQREITCNIIIYIGNYYACIHDHMKQKWQWRQTGLG